MKNDFPKLYNLLDAYYNEDWPEISGTPDGVLDDYVANNPASSTKELKQELAAVIKAEISDDELRSCIFEEMGCYYTYYDDWSSAKEWLQHILDYLP